MLGKRLGWVLCVLALTFVTGCDDGDGDADGGTDAMVSGDSGTAEDAGTEEDAGTDAGTEEDAGSDAGTPDTTIVGVAAADGRFTILVQALERVDLDDTLRGTGPFTVFAPTDTAFGTLLTELEVDGLEDIDDATLTLFLQNHVLNGEVLAAEIPSDPPIADNVADLTLWFGENDADDVTVNEATVTEADITAPTNGVIHVVDDVINPADVPAMAGIAGLSSLVAALADRDLVGAVGEETAPDLTVFAPTNEAFTALLAALSADDIAALDDDFLEAALLYHVVGARVDAEDVPTGVSTASTLSPGPAADGPTLTLLMNNDGTDIMANDATVAIADIHVTNGTIHVVDTVIAPQDIAGMATLAGLSSLVEALTDRGLEGALGTDDTGFPFTVFAPNNTAFTDFLSDAGAANIAALDDATLNATLLYHVVPGAVIESTDLAEGPNVAATLSTPDYTDTDTTAPDQMSLLVTRTGDAVTANAANVVIANVVTTSGIVHVVNAVIGRPDIVDMAGIAGLTSLAGALGTAMLVDDLQDPGPLTVFAPTDAAFGDITVPSEVGTLETVLLYHVAVDDAMASELSAGALETFSGDVTIALDPVTVTGAGNGGTASNVAIADVVVTNGVVHVIDRVLLPGT